MIANVKFLGKFFILFCIFNALGRCRSLTSLKNYAIGAISYTLMEISTCKTNIACYGIMATYGCLGAITYVYVNSVIEESSK